MILSLKSELLKLKRKRILLIAFGMVLVQLLWITTAMNYNDSTYIENGYKAFLYQLPLINALFFPTIIGVLTSRICDLEHKGNCLKSIFTMQKKKDLLNVKFLILSGYIIVIVLFQVMFVYFLSIAQGFSDPFQILDFALYFVSQTTTSIFIMSILLMLALHFNNQFIPFITGIILGFLGFMAAFFPDAIMRIIPSSYYMLLSTIAMGWDVETRIVSYYYRDFATSYLIILIILIICVFGFSKHHFKRKEV